MKFGNIENKKDIDFSFKKLPKLSEKILDNMETKSKVNFYFGAPVWTDKRYKGTLYPKNTPIKNFLKAYSQQFNSIELNATRYGTPRETTIKKWIEETPKNFKFSIKFPQVITHRKDILDYNSRTHLDKFVLALDTMGDKKGITFAVMAHYFKPNKFKDLEKFIKLLPKDISFAIELRAEEWFEDENIKNEWHMLFLENNIIPVITDTPGRRDVLHFRIVNENAFIRFVGDIDDVERINNWSNRMLELVKKGVSNIWFYSHLPSDSRENIIYFNNMLTEKINKQSIHKYKLPLIKDYRDII